MVVKTNCDPGSTGQDVLRRKTQGNIMLGAILRATAGNGPQAAVFQFAPAHVPYLSTALPRQNERLNERAERPTLARGRRPDQPQLVPSKCGPGFVPRSAAQRGCKARFR